MGMAHVEVEPDLLVHREAIRGPDARDERTGVATQMEIGFWTQGLDQFYHRFHSARRQGFGVREGGT